MEFSRFECRVRWRRRRGIPGELAGKSLQPRAMQNVMRERTSVQEHHVLQEQMVQPLQHVVHEDQGEQQGCGDATECEIEHRYHEGCRDAVGAGGDEGRMRHERG